MMLLRPRYPALFVVALLAAYLLWYGMAGERARRQRFAASSLPSPWSTSRVSWSSPPAFQTPSPSSCADLCQPSSSRARRSRCCSTCPMPAPASRASRSARPPSGFPRGRGPGHRAGRGHPGARAPAVPLHPRRARHRRSTGARASRFAPDASTHSSWCRARTATSSALGGRDLSGRHRGRRERARSRPRSAAAARPAPAVNHRGATGGHGRDRSAAGAGCGPTPPSRQRA